MSALTQTVFLLFVESEPSVYQTADERGVMRTPSERYEAME
jgi:hypothetical protein